MWKKKASWLLSFVLVVALALSFSVPVCASGSEFPDDLVVLSDPSDLDAYRVPQDDSGAYVLDDSASLLAASGDPATGTGTFSGTVSPSAVFLDTCTAVPFSITGVYYPSSSDPNIFLGVGSDNILTYEYCTGSYVFSTGAFLSIRGSNYNVLRFRFSSLPSASVSFYKSSTGLYYTRALSSGYWAVGPAQSFRSIDDFVPFFVSVNNTHVSVSDLLSYGIYRLYYIQPFYSNYLPVSSSSSTKFTYSYTTSLFDAYYASDKASLSVADLNNQTNSINSNLNQATQNQTNSINNNLNQATQNQTNTLTGGYDNSGMEATNRQLASSIASYDQAEANITDQSVDYIDAVTFFDPSTHLQLMTAVTFVSTFLQNLFVAIGDWSVLVMISLSIAFALMLVGWYKYRR